MARCIAFDWARWWEEKSKLPMIEDGPPTLTNESRKMKKARRHEANKKNKKRNAPDDVEKCDVPGHASGFEDFAGRASAWSIGDGMSHRTARVAARLELIDSPNIDSAKGTELPSPSKIANGREGLEVNIDQPSSKTEKTPTGGCENRPNEQSRGQLDSVTDTAAVVPTDKQLAEETGAASEQDFSTDNGEESNSNGDDDLVDGDEESNGDDDLVDDDDISQRYSTENRSSNCGSSKSSPVVRLSNGVRVRG